MRTLGEWNARKISSYGSVTELWPQTANISSILSINNKFPCCYGEQKGGEVGMVAVMWINSTSGSCMSGVVGLRVGQSPLPPASC